MRKRQPNETDLMFLAFDLLQQDGVDLQNLPPFERKRDLHRLCGWARIAFLRLVQTFPNGTLLLEHCEKFGFEGIVSKRQGSRHASGPNRSEARARAKGLGRAAAACASVSAADAEQGTIVIDEESNRARFAL